jgi:hypothetical protein
MQNISQEFEEDNLISTLTHTQHIHLQQFNTLSQSNWPFCFDNYSTRDEGNILKV